MENEQQNSMPPNNSGSSSPVGTNQPYLLPQGPSNNIKWLAIAIIVGSLLISAAILYSKPSGGIAPTNQPTITKVPLDDDAVLGDENAPVTMVEFSDYECPFCKKHFTEVYPEIKREYIDTGKLKLVYRDFIAVPAHNPLATTQAIAAECAREQGGDSVYFKYHDAIFTKTTSNGNGLKLTDLPLIARDLGLNVNEFSSCLNAEKYKSEVLKDIADATALGVTGTPTFFVGKSSNDGSINGTLILGAQQFSVFKTIIDQALSK